MIKISSLGVVFSLVLLFAYNALSSPTPIDFSNESEMVGFYASGHYNIEFPMFSQISVKYKSNNNEEKELHLFPLKQSDTEPNLKSKDNFNTKAGYNPPYSTNYVGVSGAIGYSGGGIRVEVAGGFTKFGVAQKDKDQIDNKYFALSTSESISDDNYIVMKNEGFRAISLTFNACYDMIIGNSSLIPSTCIGIGQQIINFLGATNIHTTFQAKLGLGFAISPKTILFINGYYVKTKDDAFKNLTVQYPVELKNDPKHIDPAVYFHSNYYGSEIGFRFIL